jgi:hypothetical protein
VADRPLRPATRRSLGGPLPRQLADGPRAHPEVIACVQRPPFPAGTEVPVVLSGISTPFGELFRTSGQITHVLRTRAPLYSPLRAFSLDLHVLGTPPAFVLSQDQTLQLRVLARHRRPLRGGSASGASCVLRSQGMRVRILSLLAIQFSKTERRPPIRSQAPSRALNAWSESRRQPACVKEGGVFTSAALARQEHTSNFLRWSGSRLREVDV